MQKKSEAGLCKPASDGDPDGIQTHNLLIRSQMLYSVKLRGRFSDGKDTNNFLPATNSADFFSRKIYGAKIPVKNNGR